MVNVYELALFVIEEDRPSYFVVVAKSIGEARLIVFKQTRSLNWLDETKSFVCLLESIPSGILQQA